MEMWKPVKMSAASLRQMAEQIALCGVPSRKNGTRGGYYISSHIAMETFLTHTHTQSALKQSRGTQMCSFVFGESGRKGSEIEAVEPK